MTTIFLKVLKELVRGKLNSRSVDLANQEKGPLGNVSFLGSFFQKALNPNKPKLSSAQKQIIDDLLTKIIMYRGSKGSDSDDALALTRLVQTAQQETQEVREENGEGRDTGDTMKCLNDLVLHINGFHEKLSKKFQFNLLDIPDSQTHEKIVYLRTIRYLGDEIFNHKDIDVKLRAAKETMLVKRLRDLRDKIKPEHTFAEQREKCIMTVTDILRDNADVVGEKSFLSGGAMPLVGLGPVNVSAPTDMAHPGKGRLDAQFKAALREIKAMKECDFESPLADKSKDRSVDYKEREPRDDHKEDGLSSSSKVKAPSKKSATEVEDNFVLWDD